MTFMFDSCRRNAAYMFSLGRVVCCPCVIGESILASGESILP